ncbi:hypothetical protein CANCADRAFT_1471 [Tortispora caseinolytica NRRL Y-17796]|uniref:Peptide N-acetyl-beta-D-glucosaminyl asparaginase amidase A N-terminal domain-containing protein n=1 Tax=Tortispora caseinolytica NRRL Y-17796 TaxID=767744 RepID=A0A1E4TM88_9ASCO|nr:hypothetical protein CANCADRAFT_1471 [Tortispora caseinolytica NRRL Y-17796]
MVRDPLPLIGQPVWEEVLFDYTFANSYGKPAVTQYVPPDVPFTNVVLKLEGSASGVQFDRLGHFFLGGNELWRTSTPEPGGDTVTWNALKDVSHALCLFKESNNMSYYLGNLVNDVYDAPIHIKLTAEFYFAPETEGLMADSIVPLTAQNAHIPILSYSGNESVLVAENLTVAKNVSHLYISIIASGNAQEEFWWTNSCPVKGNPLSSSTSSFREVQLILRKKDGTEYLLLYIWPRPVVFTGGIVPSLWRPIVSISAFDIYASDFDISAWLPLLWDGADLYVRVISDNKMSGVEADWLLSASLGYVHGHEYGVEWDQALSLSLSGTHPLTMEYSTVIENNSKDLLETVNVAKRRLWVQSLVQDTKGNLYTLELDQEHFARTAHRLSQKKSTLLTHETKVISGSNSYTRSKDGIVAVESLVPHLSFHHDISLDMQVVEEDSRLVSVYADIKRIETLHNAHTDLWTEQEGVGRYFANPEGGPGRGFATTHQKYSSDGDGGEYWRDILAVNGTIVHDYES